MIFIFLIFFHSHLKTRLKWKLQYRGFTSVELCRNYSWEHHHYGKGIIYCKQTNNSLLCYKLLSHSFYILNYFFWIQLGSDVATSSQLFYVRVFVFIVAYFVGLLDENDRFFTPEIAEIQGKEWMLYFGISCLGKKIDLSNQ